MTEVKIMIFDSDVYINNRLLVNKQSPKFSQFSCILAMSSRINYLLFFNLNSVIVCRNFLDVLLATVF